MLSAYLTSIGVVLKASVTESEPVPTSENISTNTSCNPSPGGSTGGKDG